ncbi:cell division protein ZapD [Pandoraea sp.]|uniref:cell division protein ZapD n=1 Tax=Pandoraea sp. TaxID=1883445 RepID=UPI00120A6F3F|nr:cell division protein ZapD [Pandoraea sp.]TAL56676.1 MAG: cell division protein ZapD [Pandoraea sp.]TAM15497.1 MAG: cell division protein ZapD [Pandoraea sp.]
MILYEYPLNERMRTLLRLEELFGRFAFFLDQEHPLEHHAALMTLFEIADIAGRSDLKSELAKELERQRQTLLAYRGNPDIETTTLETLLGEVERSLGNLNQIPGKPGQHLNDNEWLSSIRSRSVIPGGTCRFDLPSYYAWRHNVAEQRRADIAKWMAPLLPLRDALTLVLGLARESGQASKVMAQQGSYQQMLTGRVYHLMQVRVSPELGMIPEASANKYMLWVRFTSQDGDLRPRPVDSDVPFLLTLCNL